MATSPPPADPARRGRLAGRVLLVLTLVLVVVGVLWFFLADPLDLPERTLEALAQRASVISMQAALVFGSIGWWLQRRSAAAGEPGVPSVSTSGENAPAVGTMSGGLVAGALRGPVSTGERAPAISGDVQTLITGDLQEARRPPLPPPSSVADPSGLLGLPRRRAAWFVGRQEAWQELAITLESGTGAGVISQAVVGLGGIGKSELALQYAFARRLDYDLVWWIDADSPAQIKVGLAGLARALVAGTDSVAAGQASPEEAVAWAITWLAGRTGWLLVFDNVEEPTHLEPYLARLTIGQVLITTRRDVGWQHLSVTPLRLHTLPRPASIRLLGDLIGPPHAANAAVLDELGDLPLALTQTGAYVARTPRCTPAGYLRLLRQVPERMLATAAAGGDAERVVAKAWEVSRARVVEQNPLAEHLLQLLACYAPDHLPATVLAGAADDEQAVNEALALLASYSLITLTTHPTDPTATSGDHAADDQENVSIHRLTQAVIWHRMNAEQHDQFHPSGARTSAPQT
ncbi:hypothetical protein ACIBHY_52615 [Nonomuraea sp. NPDC050547]|uniref:hypothetical protein n=1 Tax=Nonomuraea sp. NPDC050547 TaxID=3364368 RepID=UPI0037908E23